jgi:two-component system sensor histidine kinase VicK
MAVSNTFQMTDYLTLFRSFLARRSEILFAYDVAARQVVYVSEAYEQLTGDPADHVPEDWPHLLTAVHPDDWQYLCQQVAQAGPGALVEDVELRLERHVDTQWLRVSVQQVADAEGQLFVLGAVRDITAEKAVALNAQKFSTKKDATLEILSHDLAGPLALMQQLADQLRYELPEANAMTHQLLDLMQRTCQQGTDLIRDFVDAEFLESANVELKTERADLAAWLGQAMQEYQQSEQLTQLHFEYTPYTQPLYVHFDVNKLQQVLNNLVSNSIKFTPDGGYIRVRLERHGTYARITVADTGVGIPAGLQPLLFEKFTKARRPGLRGEKTTGLGMSVIQTIVGLHHGRIWFDSTEGHGTSMYVEVPALAS